MLKNDKMKDEPGRPRAARSISHDKPASRHGIGSGGWPTGKTAIEMMDYNTEPWERFRRLFESSSHSHANRVVSPGEKHTNRQWASWSDKERRPCEIWIPIARGIARFVRKFAHRLQE
jgi:hypothetical protein